MPLSPELPVASLLRLELADLLGTVFKGEEQEIPARSLFLLLGRHGHVRSLRVIRAASWIARLGYSRLNRQPDRCDGRIT